MENTIEWLKSSIWGMLIIGAIGSIMGAYFISPINALAKKVGRIVVFAILPAYKKWMSGELLAMKMAESEPNKAAAFYVNKSKRVWIFTLLFFFYISASAVQITSGGVFYRSLLIIVGVLAAYNWVLEISFYLGFQAQYMKDSERYLKELKELPFESLRKEYQAKGGSISG